MYAIWELHVCEMAYGKGTPMRDARLWDGFCEKHAYERHAYLHRLEKRGSLRGRRGRGIRVGWVIAFYPPLYLRRPGFSTSQDDLGKTKRSLGLGASYLVSS